VLAYGLYSGRARIEIAHHGVHYVFWFPYALVDLEVRDQLWGVPLESSECLVFKGAHREGILLGTTVVSRSRCM
jgi:hypothetical protein